MRDLGLTFGCLVEALGDLVTGAPLEAEILNAKVAGISVDSRTLAAGEIFVALTGENFDGHDYVEAALKAGALAVVVEKSIPNIDAEKCVVVSDSLLALGKMANAIRKKQDLKVVALTGSNGKTTTKEMLASILRRKDPKLLATSGNFNNQVGLPLTIFKVDSEASLAVLEMGTNHFGEIASLGEIAEPNVALITSVGAAHLEHFESVKEVARAKGEIYASLQHGGTAVVNADEPLLVEAAQVFKGHKLYFGQSDNAQVRLLETKSLGLDGQEIIVTGPGLCAPRKIVLRFLGAHNALNAVAAASAALAAGATWAQIICGLEDAEAPKGRLNLVETKNFKVLDDTYNGNPTSVAAALRFLASLDSELPKGAILGDMLELGKDEAAHHQEIGRLAAELVNCLALVGPRSEHTYKGARAFGMSDDKLRHFDLASDAAKWAAASWAPGTVVLLKGSRSSKIEEALNFFEGS